MYFLTSYHTCCFAPLCSALLCCALLCFALLGCLFGCSWMPFGCFLGPFLASWAALGPLLAALGTILERHAKIMQKSMPKMTDLDSQKGGQREAKSKKKRIKIEDKNRYEKNTSSRSPCSRFGMILGCFLTALELKNVDFSLVFKRFRENSLF